MLQKELHRDLQRFLTQFGPSCVGLQSGYSPSRRNVRQRLAIVPFGTDKISAGRYGLAMKILQIVPAVFVVICVAVLVAKRGMMFVP
jgi:hypothetical protein